MAKDYFPIDENPETSLRACAFFLAQDLGEPKAQAEILTRIVGHYLAAGELDLAAQALEPLYDVSDSHEREQRFAELAAVAASAGHDDFAVSLAEACEDFTWADAARHDAALAQAERGDYAAARAMVAPLAYPEPSLVEVARFAAEKDEAQALSIAADIEEPRARSVVLLEVAARRAAAGRGADALNLLLATETVLPQIDLPDEHLDALCTLGTRYAALERREKALQLLAQAQAIAEDAADDNMLLRVADSYLAMGDTDRALYVAEEIDAFDISWFYANIAHAQARAGDFASARKLLATLKEDQHQGRGCLFLARAYQENGDEANFQAQLARALALARDTRVKTNEDAKSRAALLGAIAAEYLEKDAAQARAVAASMPEGPPLDEVWQRIAAQEAADGRWRDALNTAENIAAPAARAQTQTALARQIAEFEARTTKNWTLVHTALDAISPQVFPARLAARLDVADFLAQQGADDEADKLRQSARQEAEAQERPAVAALGLATIAARATDPDAAAQLFSAAVAQTAPLKDPYAAARALLDLADIRDKIGVALDETAQILLQQHLPV